MGNKIQGLRGVYDLSNKDYDKWYKAQDEAGKIRYDYSKKDIDRLYRNQQFIKNYGMDLFNSLDKDQRDAYHRAIVLDQVKKERFGDNQDIYNQLSLLSDDNLQQLLENDDFKNDQQIQEEYESVKKARSNSVNELMTSKNPFNSIAAAGVSNLNSTDLEDDRKKNLEEKRNKLLDDAVNSEAKKQKANTAPLAKSYKENMLEAFGDNKISIDDVNNTFEELAQNSNYYKAFKDDVFKNFTTEDKIEAISNAEAIMSNTGNSYLAIRSLDNDMRNFVADNQSKWDQFWTGSKMWTTTYVSDMANTVLPIVELAVAIKDGKQGIKNALDGKSHYLDNVGFLLSPKYWDNVSNYNLWTRDAQQKAIENGGLSDASLVFKEEDENGAWHTYLEGQKMSGFIASELTKALLLKGAGRAVESTGISLGGGLSFTRNVERGINFMQRATSGVSIAQAYAMGVYEETAQKALQRYENTLDRNLSDVINNTIINSPEYQEQINNLTQKYLDEDIKYNQTIGKELNQWRIPSEENARYKATQEVYANIKSKFLNEDGTINDALLEQSFGTDEEGNPITLADKGLKTRKSATEQATDDALYGFIVDWTTEYLRNTALDWHNRKWMYQGSTRVIPKAGNQVKGLIQREGRVIVDPSKTSKYAKRLWTASKGVIGGATSNYNDDLTTAFSEGLVLGDYDNYLTKQYDPDSEITAYKWLDSFNDGLYNLSNAANSVKEMATSEQALRDAKIGGLGSLPFSPLSIAMGAVNARMNRASNEYARRMSGRTTLTFADKINNWISNPITGGYVEALNNEAQLEKSATTINKIYEDNKDKLEDFAKLALYIHSDVQGAKSIMELKDQRAADAIDIVLTLARLSETSDAALQLPAVKDAIEAMERWEGNTGNSVTNVPIIKKTLQNIFRISPNETFNEDIEEARNRDIQEYMRYNNGSTEKEARERISKNVNDLIEVIKRYDKFSKKLQSANMEIYDDALKNAIVSSNLMSLSYRERLDQIEKEINGGTLFDKKGNITRKLNPSARFNTKKAYEADIAQREEEIAKQEERIATLKEEIEKHKKDYKKAKFETDEDGEYTGKKSYEEARDVKTTANTHIGSLKFRLNLLEENLKAKKADLEALKEEGGKKFESTENTDEIIRAEEILAMHPEDRAYMLAPYNRKNFRGVQIKEINKAIELLNKKDPSLMQKIEDASELSKRLNDNERVSMIMEGIGGNVEDAVNFFIEAQELKKNRLEAAYKKFNTQRIFDFLDKLSSARDIHRSAHLFNVNRLQEYINLMDPSDTRKPYFEEAVKFGNLIKSLSDSINDITSDKDSRELFRNIFRDVIFNSENENELYSFIENRLDQANLDKLDRNLLEEILERAKAFGFVRDQSRIDRRRGLELKRQREAEKQKREEEKKKQEEVAKQEKERIEKEAKAKEEEEKRKQEEDKSSKGVLKILAECRDAITEILKPLEKRSEYSNMPAVRKNDLIMTIINIALHTDDYDTIMKSIDKAFEDAGIPKLWNNIHALGVDRNALSRTIINSYKEIHSEDSKEKSSEETTEGTISDDTLKPQSNESQLDNVEKGEEGNKESLENPIPDNKPEELEEPKADNTPDVEAGQQGDLSQLNYDPVSDSYYLDSSEAAEFDEEDKSEGNKEVEDVTPDVSSTNSVESQNELAESEPTVLLGNKYQPYDFEAAKSHKQVPSPQNEDTQFREIIEYLTDKGIKLQDIIDNELYEILQKSPKIYFGGPKVNTQKTNVFDALYLYVEATPEVKAIHNKEYGGIFESNGKEYLIIGVAGFQLQNKAQGDYYRQVLYDNKVARHTYFQSNPTSTDEVFVDTSVYTELNHFYPGYLMRQLLGDDVVTIKNMADLANGEVSERNPLGLSLGQLSWIIQTKKGCKLIGNADSKVFYAPLDSVSNVGNTFALIKTANGFYAPAYIIPARLSEIKDGELKDTINKLLIECTSPEFSDRVVAIKQLIKLIYLDRKGINISIGTENNNTLCVTNYGVVVARFTPGVDSAQNFIDTVNYINPRINLTQSTLSDPETLRIFSKAGALNTDLAKLGVSSSQYTILPMKNGVPDRTNAYQEQRNPIGERSSEEIAKNKEENSVVFKGITYRRENNGTWRDSSYNVVTDANVIRTLNYAVTVKDRVPEISNSSKKAEWHILRIDENDPIVAFKTSTSNVTILSKEDAKKVIDTYIQNKINEERNKRAQEELEAMKKQEESQNSTNKNRETEKDEDIVAEDTLTNEELEKQALGDFVPAAPQAPVIIQPTVATEAQGIPTPDKTEIKPVPEKEAPSSDMNTLGGKTNAELHEKDENKGISVVKAARTLDDFTERLNKILWDKWGFKAKKTSDKVKFLKSKGRVTENITDIDKWLQELKDC